MAAPVSQRRGLPAWLLSLGLHAVIVLLLGFTLPVAPRGAALEPERAGGIVLVQPSQDKVHYLSEGGEESARAEQQSAAQADDPLPAQQEPPLELAGGLPSPEELLAGQPLGEWLPGADTFARGLGPPAKLEGNQARTGVFGVTGTGSRFVYVFDRSGSMDGFQGRPFAAAKSELLNSLEVLEGTHQFQIIFYNHLPLVFNPDPGRQPRMLFGDESSKRLAEKFVRGVVADGGTHHMDALRMALRLQPDVIFFLTDADEPELTPGELAEIRRLNRRSGAMIHAIEFGTGPYTGRDNFLVKLARDSGGQHAYVDVSRLPHRP